MVHPVSTVSATLAVLAVCMVEERAKRTAGCSPGRLLMTTRTIGIVFRSLVLALEALRVIVVLLDRLRAIFLP